MYGRIGSRLLLASEIAEEYLLPARYSPTKEAFEALGFKFSPYLPSAVLCQAQLPPNWSMKSPGNVLLYTYIFDGEGRKRATCYYDPDNGHALMSLEKRYRIEEEEVPITDDQTQEKPPVFTRVTRDGVYAEVLLSPVQICSLGYIFNRRRIVVKDADGTVIFYAGEYFECWHRREGPLSDSADEDHNIALEKAKKFLAENLPDHEDPEAYWGLETSH
jgi:hypothetical protein